MNNRHLPGRRGLCLVVPLVIVALPVTAGPAAARPRHSAETFAYIANKAGGSVSVIDTADARHYNPVVQTTLSLRPSGGDQPFGVAVPPVNRGAYYKPHRAYTANSTYDGTMSVIESTPGPDPRYDPWSHRVVATVPVPGCPYPRGIAARPNGKRVFLACGRGTVAVMDTETLTEVANIPLYNNPKGSIPYSIHVTPGGTKVYVVDQVQRKLIVINASNPYSINKRVNLPAEQPEGVHVDRRGRSVWITYSTAGAGEIGVSVLSTYDEGTLKNIRFQDNAYPASVYARSRSQAWVTLWGTNELAEVRWSSSRVSVRRTPVGASPQGLTADRRRNVYVVNWGGSVTTVFRRRFEPPVTLGVGSQPWGIGEFIAPRRCTSCRI